MDEKEIIKWNGNFKKEAKIIIIVAISITLLFVIYFGIIDTLYSRSKSAYKEMETILGQKTQELNDKSREIEVVKNNYIQTKNKRIEYDGQYLFGTYRIKNTYYIDDKEVTEEEYYEKLEEYNKEATQTEEYKKVSEKYNELQKEYEIISNKYNKTEENLKSVRALYYGLDIIFGGIFVGIGIIVLTIVFYFYISKMEITVTNTRVYGKKAFGKRVDLPVDTISAIGLSFLKGIDIGTSSGRIHFKGIKNNVEIHTEISKLLNERQKGNEVITEKNSVDEIKKYKELLDSGIINQEEFDKKKRELLNL